MTVDAKSRIDQIKASGDIAWLLRVKSPNATDQLTVREAARRRIRQLRKQWSILGPLA